MNKKDKEQFIAMADKVDGMVQELRSRGFTREEAVQMVCGMLSSSQVYIPFAELTMERGVGGMH